MNAIVRYIQDIERIGGLRGTDIANVADVSKATVSRWLSGKAQPQPANELKLSELSYVIGRLDDYYSADEIRSWLHAPHPQLDGARAIDLIHAGRSEEVLQIIRRLDAEAYL